MKKPKGILIPTARKLRRMETDTERHLWRLLRAKQFRGLKFRRQVPIGPYIVDFVCYQKKVVIECDGGQHANEVQQDQNRDRWLQSQGFQVLRFWNHDVLKNRDGILEIISPSPSSPPIKGGEKDF